MMNVVVNNNEANSIKVPHLYPVVLCNAMLYCHGWGVSLAV